MSFSIPIWPGSSSFAPGKTPFGLYDSDAQFVIDADRVALWSSRRLGYPIMDIELQDINFYACFEEAVTEYSTQVNQFNARENMLNLIGTPTGSSVTQREVSPNFGKLIKLADAYGTEAGTGGNVTYKTGSIDIQSQIQNYDLNTLWRDIHEPGEVIEIKRIFHHEPPAIARYFDPLVGTGFESGVGITNVIQEFGFGGFSIGTQFVMYPMYEDVLRLQAIEMNEQIRRSAFSFELRNNKLRLFPVPAQPTKLYFEYIVRSERDNPLKSDSGVVSDISNIPYTNMTYAQINDIGKQWIRKYSLALAKEMLGQVRSKYASVPFPGQEISLNGPELLSQAATEKDQLITEIKETLEQTSRSAQLEKQKQETENLQETFNRIPLGIYIR